MGEEELCRLFPALFESMKTCEACATRDHGDGMVRYGKHVFGPTFEDGKSVARNVLFTEEVQCLRTNADLSYQRLQKPSNMVKAGFVVASAPLFGRGHDSAFEHYRASPEEW